MANTFQKMITLFFFTVAFNAAAGLVGKDVVYTSGDTKMNGYLVYDDAIDTKRPGILVVHEWWGHNAYARQRAEQLATMGYTTLAVDMYGEGKQADHPKDAGAFSSAVMSDVANAQKRFEAALILLNEHPTTDPTQNAAIGYCFGGGVVLHMARFGVDLDGVASFHGSLGTEKPAVAGAVKAKMLVCNGADDPFVTAEQIEGIKKEMADAGADLVFKNYPGAKHSFTNPGSTAIGKKFELPLVYNPAADKQSWADLTAFLDQLFK